MKKENETDCQPKYCLSRKQILQALPLANYNNKHFIPLKNLKRNSQGEIHDNRYLKPTLEEANKYP